MKSLFLVLGLTFSFSALKAEVSETPVAASIKPIVTAESALLGDDAFQKYFDILSSRDRHAFSCESFRVAIDSNYVCYRWEDKTFACYDRSEGEDVLLPTDDCEVVPAHEDRPSPSIIGAGNLGLRPPTGPTVKGLGGKLPGVVGAGAGVR